MCQPIIPALLRVVQILVVVAYRVPVVPSDFNGTMPAIGTIQQALNRHYRGTPNIVAIILGWMRSMAYVTPPSTNTFLVFVAAFKGETLKQMRFRPIILAIFFLLQTVLRLSLFEDA